MINELLQWAALIGVALSGLAFIRHMRRMEAYRADVERRLFGDGK